MAAIIVVQDGTGSGSVVTEGVHVQRFSYGQRSRVFEVTGAGDKNSAKFVQGTFWIEGSSAGRLMDGCFEFKAAEDGAVGDEAALRIGTLAINPGGAAITADVNHTSVAVNGNFMTGGPAVVQVQFRGTVVT